MTATVPKLSAVVESFRVGGTGVLVGVGVGGTGVLVGVAVGGTGVLVGVAVGGTGVLVGVAVALGVAVGVAVALGVAVGVAVAVGVEVAVAVGVGVGLHFPKLPALAMAAISPSLSARLKTSTSSMSPPNVAQLPDPPISNGAVVVGPRLLPLADATSVPLM